MTGKTPSADSRIPRGPHADSSPFALARRPPSVPKRERPAELWPPLAAASGRPVAGSLEDLLVGRPAARTAGIGAFPLAERLADRRAGKRQFPRFAPPDVPRAGPQGIRLRDDQRRRRAVATAPLAVPVSGHLAAAWQGQMVKSRRGDRAECGYQRTAFCRSCCQPLTPPVAAQRCRPRGDARTDRRRWATSDGHTAAFLVDPAAAITDRSAPSPAIWL